jgi:hypothetical protein
MMFDAMLAEGIALCGSVSNGEMVTPRVLICKVLCYLYPCLKHHPWLVGSCP